MSPQIQIKYPEKLHKLFTTPKRLKIVVGGRGSCKSTAVADYVLAMMSQGQLWCCAREFQNSLDESVHRTIEDEIERLGLSGFESSKSDIKHSSGGRNFYRGLSRNITSLKSTLSGVDGLWIEEGEDLSANTLRVLTASVRLNAKDTERKIRGEDIKMPEIWVTMNRGSRADPVSEKWLERAESTVERQGWYEDDMMIVVEVNYPDVPKEWFEASGLEVERLDDFNNMSRAGYDSKWLGKYLDEVDDSIIMQEWFDAAIDAHEKLGFKPRGAIVTAFDPSDGGDSAGYVTRHGSVITEADERIGWEVNDSTDWALEEARRLGTDVFVWDGDGMGAPLRAQIANTLEGTKTEFQMFKGSYAVENPTEVYMGSNSNTIHNSVTNEKHFKNRRAQYYGRLADKFYATYRAVEHGEYHDPDTLISISSEIKLLSKLRTELCRIPRKRNNNGFFQIMTKEDMKRIHGIPSPALADSAMMGQIVPRPQDNYEPITIPQRVGFR